uniref:Uncharacterized protein n=1 Tax=Oryza punctata TaxID=4537 RepID=A0A0E0MJW5_ORYPU
MTSADDEGVDARASMKTTKATTQLQLRVDAAAISPIGDEAMLRREPLNTATTSGVATPKLDGVYACLMTIGCRSRCNQALEWVIKTKMREVER